MPSTTIQWFKYDHLPPELRLVVAPIADVALIMEHELPDGPEKSAGMRKLLEAKDCFVRAAIVPEPDTFDDLPKHVVGRNMDSEKEHTSDLP